MRIQLMSAAAAGYIGFAKHKWAALEELRKSSGVAAMQKFIDTGEVRIFLRCGVDPLIRLEGDPKEHALWLLPSSDSATGDATLASAPKTTWRKGRMKDPVAGVLDWKGFYKKDKDGNAYWTDNLSWHGPPCRYAPGYFGTTIYRNGAVLATANYSVYGAAKVQANGTTWLVAAIENGLGVSLVRQLPDGEWETVWSFTPPDNSFDTTDKTIYDSWWTDKASTSRYVRFPWLFSSDGLKAVTQWPLVVEDYEWTYYTRPLEISLDVSAEEWQVTSRWLGVTDGLVVDGAAEPWNQQRSGAVTTTLTVRDDNAEYVEGVEWERDRTLAVSDSLSIEAERILFADFAATDLAVLIRSTQSQQTTNQSQVAEYHIDADPEVADTQAFSYSGSQSYTNTETFTLSVGGVATPVEVVARTGSYTVTSSSSRTEGDDGWAALDGYLFDATPDSSALIAAASDVYAEVVHADLRHGFVGFRTTSYVNDRTGSGGFFDYTHPTPDWYYSLDTYSYTDSETIKLAGVAWEDSETKTATYETDTPQTARANRAFALGVDMSSEGYSTPVAYDDALVTSDDEITFWYAKIWAGFLADDVFAVNGTLRLDGGYEDRFYSRYQPINLTDVVELPAGDNQMYRPIGVAGYMPRNKI